MNTKIWLDGNAKYLFTSLTWLRLKLERIGLPVRSVAFSMPAPVDPATIANPSTFWQELFTRPITAVPPSNETSEANTPADAVGNNDEKLAQVQAARENAAQMDPPPALIMLGKKLGLTPFEQNILLLCAALELDSRFGNLCARAQGDINRPYPTFGLAMALFDDWVWNALLPERPLRSLRLIEINQPGAQPLTTSPLRADERIVNYLIGLETFDDRLANFLSPLRLDLTLDGTPEIPSSQQSIVDEMTNLWNGTPDDLQVPILQLLGPDPLSKQLVVSEVAKKLDLQVYYLTAATLPTQFGDLEILARLWQRESTLYDRALYLDAQEVDAGVPDQFAAVQRFITRADGKIILGTRERWQNLERGNFSFDIYKPTTAEQQAIWEKALGGRGTAAARQLAAQFNLNATTIAQIAGSAASDREVSDEELKRTLWAACSAITRPRLDALAQRIDPKATWDNLVLPGEQSQLLHQIAYQVGQRQTVYEDWGFGERMNRGLGISALFAGGSGTGKTMAAEVIANDLQLNLYRIDLSAVVSKYIGETEKNLRRLFDAAEDGGAILFFDEADAMFGKRSEVKDSHDRYANIEVSYLLQRMEAYRGLAILATNIKTAIDPAFMRRLRFIVNFPFPGPNERKTIWQKVFPPKALDEEEALDYDRLSRFNITGGNIQSIALNAAFMAAHRNLKVNMPIILSAVRTEFRKLEMAVNEAEFIWKESQVRNQAPSKPAGEQT